MKITDIQLLSNASLPDVANEEQEAIDIYLKNHSLVRMLQIPNKG